MKSGYTACGWRVFLGICLSLVTANVLAASAGDWLVRGRIITVSPNVNSDDVLGAGTNTPVDVSDDTSIELDLTYMVNPNVGLELIFTTTTHDITAEGNISALGTIAQTSVLAPTMTLQYHFLPASQFRPYIGAGFNYTMFYDEKTTDSLTNGLMASSSGLELEDSFGYAVQAGIDMDISNGWFLNADIKYLNIETKATVKANNTTAAEFNLDVNPFIYGIGIGKKF